MSCLCRVSGRLLLRRSLNSPQFFFFFFFLNFICNRSPHPLRRHFAAEETKNRIVAAVHVTCHRRMCCALVPFKDKIQSFRGILIGSGTMTLSLWDWQPSGHVSLNFRRFVFDVCLPPEKIPPKTLRNGRVVCCGRNNRKDAENSY